MQNLCSLVEAIGLVVALEVASKRASVPVVAHEQHIFPCITIQQHPKIKTITLV
jgi:hemolysin-activating ACP:hemolysin acyltransferase